MPKFRYSVFSLCETKHETLEAKDEDLASCDVKKVRQPQPQHVKASANTTEVALEKKGWRKPAHDGRAEQS